MLQILIYYALIYFIVKYPYGSLVQDYEAYIGMTFLASKAILVTFSFRLFVINIYKYLGRLKSFLLKISITLTLCLLTLFPNFSKINEQFIIFQNLWGIDSKVSRMDEPILYSNNYVIYYDGEINKQGVEKINTALQENTTTLVLNSNGGYIESAFEISEIVEKNRLTTLVNNSCLSACTIIFSAGIKRILSESGKLGFHQSIKLLTKNLKKDTYSNFIVKQWFIKKGYSKSFVEKAWSVPNEEIWYPTRDELNDAGILE